MSTTKLQTGTVPARPWLARRISAADPHTGEQPAAFTKCSGVCPEWERLLTENTSGASSTTLIS